MRAFELWAGLSKELNHEIFEAACLNEKRLYRHAVEELSEGLRRRPQVVLELPRAARHELFQPLMGLRQFDTLGFNLVINWLRKKYEPLLVRFMDGVGAEHDGHGCAEVFPQKVPAAKLERACQSLYEQFPEEAVTFYLRLFSNITGTDWGVEQFVKTA
ncbi:MAG: hypothetical protein LBD30_01485 [Verrucomicrobiales bacterium]|jgi:hypothetical protein|nr:hypothetical protein [Verrucomicrobiales bacterium]